MKTDELAKLLPSMIGRVKDENGVILGEAGLLRIDKEDDNLWAVYYVSTEDESIFIYNKKTIIAKADTMCKAFDKMHKLLTKYGLLC